MTKATTYTEVKEILGNNGFTLENAMDKSKDGKGIFDDLYTVEYNSTKVLYIRKNENDTFNTFELLNYPTSFSKNMNNVSLEKLIEILQSVVKNNFNEDVKPTKKQIEVITKMVKEFSKVHNNEKRLELLGWYDLASSVKNIEVTRKIMTDLKAI